MADLTRFPRIFQETPDTIRARINADANVGLAPTDPGFLDTTAGGFWYDLTQAPILEIARLYDALNEFAAAVLLPFSWGVYLDEHGVTINEQRKDPVAATGVVTFTGTDGTQVPTHTQVAIEQTNPDVDPIVFETTESGTITGGALDLAVEAVAFGSSGNVPAGAVSVLLSPVLGISAVTNAVTISGGADVESDQAYLNRLLIAFAGAHGAGTEDDYVQWSLAYPGVGNVKVEPLWNGPGTVRVIVADVDNNAVSQAVIDGLQARLDPFAVVTELNGAITLPTSPITLASTVGLLPNGQVMIGNQLVSYTGISGANLTGATGGTGAEGNHTRVTQSGLGAGLAPVGAVVTVATVTSVGITVAVTVTPKPGYSVAGTGVQLEAAIQAAATRYINGLAPGDDVVLKAVEAAVMDVTGVLDITSLTLNGAAANVAVSALQVATTTAVNVS